MFEMTTYTVSKLADLYLGRDRQHLTQHIAKPISLWLEVWYPKPVVNQKLEICSKRSQGELWGKRELCMLCFGQNLVNMATARGSGLPSGQLQQSAKFIAFDLLCDAPELLTYGADLQFRFSPTLDRNRQNAAGIPPSLC